MHKTPTILVVLSCLHTAVFIAPPPRIGERVYCMRCGAYRDAVEAPHDYTVKCESCRYERGCGNARITAETAAVHHTHRKPGHRVRLVDGDRVVDVYRQEPLPANVDVPPF